VNAPMAISLEVGPNVGEPVRSRIEYAFRVFAAIYGHAVIDGDGSQNAIRCCYGAALPLQAARPTFFIPALYQQTLEDTPRKLLSKFRYAGEDFYLACGRDSSTGRPDWLGEIFLWLSGSHELGIAQRDSVGRIPYSETVFSREGISPRKPRAAQIMAWMENALRRGDTAEALPRAPSPVSDSEHLVVCSHDIDFYHVDWSSAFIRLAKNLVIALLNYRSSSFFIDNLRMMLQLFSGKRTGDYLPALLSAAHECGFESTLFVVARQGHRRDPNYKLEQIAKQLLEAAKQGFRVGLHGSYRSIIEDGTLAEESRRLGDCMGKRPITNRQHWLRFANHQVLFNEIERAGLQADSTLGFSEAAGFRNGACFAFPPYNFAQERPCNFLEVPMVLMDGSVEEEARASGVAPQQLADEVLGESRKYGWGGISVIWHNPIESLSVPREINAVFWNCARQKSQHGEKWLSLEQFLLRCSERYQKAGLLTSAPVGLEEQHTGV